MLGGGGGGGGGSAIGAKGSSKIELQKQSGPLNDRQMDGGGGQFDNSRACMHEHIIVIIHPDCLLLVSCQ